MARGCVYVCMLLLERLNMIKQQMKNLCICKHKIPSHLRIHTNIHKLKPEKTLKLTPKTQEQEQVIMVKYIFENKRKRIAITSN